MSTISKMKRLLMLFVALSTSLACEVRADQPAESSTSNKPVKVFILMGQSNMVGFGAVGNDTTKGSLAYMVKNQKKYLNLVDKQGNWIERNDVWMIKVTTGQRQGWLKPGYGARDKFFGPELGFGNIMGDYYDEPIVMIKASQGNRSLFWDILPPGSPRIEYDGKTYAGYGDSIGVWSKDNPGKKVEWYGGKQYDDFVNDTKTVLKDFKKYYPDYNGQGIEIAGFVWWQGHKDQYEPAASYYEKNLVTLIKSLRKDFKAPNAPIVIATIGFGGWNMKEVSKKVAEAQLAVSGEKGKYPEFKGNVKTIESRGFWREKEISPSKQDYHYNWNAETYMEVSNALGKAMVELISKKK